MTEDFRRTHDWGALTRAEIAAARDAGALPVLTVGSVEQHSDHLPVDTDTLSAYRITMAAAERCPAPHVLVLPPPSFGFSPHHRAWAGTITLSLETFIGMVTDSRSFMSFPRHEYFRRVLCNLLGDDIGKGELPNDMELIGDMVRNICFANARDYLGLELPRVEASATKS